jgi:multisubunit Na+/H+ antiporter MnhB subunit
MESRQHPSRTRTHASSNQWSLAAFALAGALLGVVIGLLWGWLDYGRPDLGFMYGHVIGLAAICAALGLAVAAVRNWARRNPMA